MVYTQQRVGATPTTSTKMINIEKIREVITDVAELKKETKENKRIITNGVWASKVTTKDISDFIKTIEDNWKILDEKITKLKERDKDQEETITLLKTHINELKEEMKIFKGAVINYNHDYDRIRNVRETLRELWNKYLNYITNDNWKTNDYIKEQRELLEKLDGKTELTTVIGTKVYTEVVADIIKNDKETEKKVTEISVKNDQKSLVSPYYACGEPKDHTDTNDKDPYIQLQKEAFDDSDEFPFEASGG